MSELPNGWAEVELGRLLEPIQTGDPRKTPDQHFRYVDIGSIDNKTQSIAEPKEICGADAPSRARRFIKGGDVLFSTVRTYLKNIAMVPDELDGQLTSTGIAVLRASQATEPRFVFNLVCSDQFISAVSLKQDGTMYPAISDKDLLSHTIALPPLAEQKRIVAKLDALSARSARARKDLARIDTLVTRYKQAVLSKAFSGELTKDWRIQHTAGEDSLQEVEAAERLKQGRLRIRGASKVLEGIELEKLPVGWNWIQNYRLAKDASNAICAGPFGTIFKAKDFRSEGVPIIFLRHVGEGEYLTHKPNFMDPEVWSKLHQQYSVHGGELLVTKLGDPPGTACIYPKGIGTAMVTPDVMKMSVDECVASKLYLMNYFNSPTCKKMIGELAFGLTRLRVDLGMFKGFPIPLAPISEQQEIVRRIESAFQKIDRLAAEAKRALELTDKLDEAILAKAFRGELVPQDPNDEPASVLLERIKAERQAAPKAKRGRKRKS
ncbi:hypothetical protein Q669_23620 [Labrenzia sp. C1B10]|uniref:restriction endonuclease subunit S n=1 Tax=unclassified Labrenzia TaxID=2648686 RepID=UPI0003B7EBE2|nr:MULTISPECIES: restriction endonuclease subunit S [unclassified Labrenzia]ERP98188.1 hypothetical protein Q669_23620 [Labrenzia sp. C1B10]ERS01980.1 hypothetical protein Q675_07735 [Labrenzia sp. C1B70]